jgi:hypothetical protein
MEVKRTNLPPKTLKTLLLEKRWGQRQTLWIYLEILISSSHFQPTFLKQAYAISMQPVWMFQPIFMKLSMYMTAVVPISTTYFINPSHRSVRLYVYRHVVARQRLGKKNTLLLLGNGSVKTLASNTQATIELLNASFSVRSVSYQLVLPRNSSF